ncbi:MAG: mechanosensitive ion channel, partial [Magnetococcales bacterium]|nr:mechanosensitive ion channel [Magnetococcales bacterium]
GKTAQRFQHDYISSYNGWPDWVAAYAYDAAHLMATALIGAVVNNKEVPIQEMRQRLRDTLASKNKIDNAFVGVNGPLFFNVQGTAARSPLVGLYDGANLIAALTQLSPIREEGVTNLLQEVTSGRALYVNDRFMYKTNVVYTGVRLEKIAALDRASNTADIDFAIWFRWRGDFEPQNVVFTNAVEPITLEQPVREGKDGDLLYRVYRVKGKFYLNYSDITRSYGTLLVGLAFHHRVLGRNNLMYVNDIIGMNLMINEESSNQGQAVATEDKGLWQQVVSAIKLQAAHTDPLVETLRRDKILAGVNGWLIERASTSQDLLLRNVEGNPLFVGFGKPRPFFSMMDVGVILKPDRLDARDFISSTTAFIYLAILSLNGSLLARVLERDRNRRQFWRLQTLLLRLICWPVLLISTGNLIRDYGLQKFSTATVDNIVLLYDILWWYMPATLVTISMERFLWVPLEIKTERKIPNIIRISVALVIYTLTTFGMVTFVMGQSITSLLATSGMMAMIIGMAVQSNLRDVFSGIILNIERPFAIGDFVKINNILGKVTDITWRTTRILSDDGQSISFPNSKTSDAETHNFSKARCANTSLNIYVDPRYNPTTVLQALQEVLPQVTSFVRDIPDDEPSVYFVGVECVSGHWVSRFMVSFSVRHMGKKKKASQELWQLVWQRFNELGIEWRDLDGEEGGIAMIEPAKKS